MGGLSQVFYGDRTKANDFINEVKAYLHLNADVVGYNSPFKKATFTLTLIKGESTAQWVRDMGNWLNGLIMPQENIPNLWKQFLDKFCQQFQDTQAVTLDWAWQFLLPHSSGQLCILYTGDQVR